MGFFLGALLYFFMSFAPPLRWSMAGWVVIAFGFIPALIGLVNGLMKRKHEVNPPGFQHGFRPAAWAMFLYAGCSMMIAHGRVGASGSGIATFFVGFVVAIFYALIAGVAAGAVCAAAAKMRTGRTA